MLLATHLEKVKLAADSATEAEFLEAYGDYAFILEGSSPHGGKVIELCQDGATKGLTKANAEEYIDLYLRAYTRLDSL